MQKTAILKSVGLALAVMISMPVMAQSASNNSGALTLRAGTLGLGLDYSRPVSQGLSLRGNINGFSTSRDYTVNNTDYQTDFRLRTAGVLLDWYPFASGFRFSGGLYYDGNKADLKPRNSASGPFGSNAGSVTGSLDFRKAAPYLGLGYNRSFGAFSVTGEAGVMFAGSPQTRLNVDCTGLTPTTCNSLRSSAAAEEARVRSDLDALRYYPVLSVGVGYAF